MLTSRSGVKAIALPAACRGAGDRGLGLVTGATSPTLRSVWWRRAILDELVERDGQTLFELCTRLTMKHQMALTRQAISQHLAVLESAGLVTTVRQGKYKLHYLHTEPLRHIVERWLKSENKGEP